MAGRHRKGCSRVAREPGQVPAPGCGVPCAAAGGITPFNSVTRDNSTYRAKGAGNGRKGRLPCGPARPLPRQHHCPGRPGHRPEASTALPAPPPRPPGSAAINAAPRQKLRAVPAEHAVSPSGAASSLPGCPEPGAESSAPAPGRSVRAPPPAGRPRLALEVPAAAAAARSPFDALPKIVRPWRGGLQVTAPASSRPAPVRPAFRTVPLRRRLPPPHLPRDGPVGPRRPRPGPGR